MLILVVLRRLSLRGRMITGVVLVVAGLGLVAVSAAVLGLLVHGVALLVVGAVFCASAVLGGRRNRLAKLRGFGGEPVSRER